jgi:hypothetical protein
LYLIVAAIPKSCNIFLAVIIDLSNQGELVDKGSDTATHPISVVVSIIVSVANATSALI